MVSKSPLAPKSFPDIPAIPGIQISTGACGVRYSRKTDLLLVVLSEETQVAGVFTKSKTAAAPIDWCRKCLRSGNVRALVANSGNANAFTGSSGVAAVERIASRTSQIIGCLQDDVFVASTGVIGEELPDHKITDALESLYKSSGSDWKTAAQAIGTTDTFPKGSCKKVKIGETEVIIGGIAKGSGMIAPDMATMLAFVFTDAKIPNDILQQLLSKSVDRSFNSITVDSDTSTNDTVLLFATGQTFHEEVSSVEDKNLEAFVEALELIMIDLAQQIVRDGEGATKFIKIKVSGAFNDDSARKIGLSIANSPLVKTAIAGEDANWGRIVMAVGKSGERADRDKLCISVGGIEVASLGQVVENYDEAPVAAHMRSEEIDIDVDVGIGAGVASVWTCDLTHKYISINADYRT
ncbi:MAG: bifunctional glutamate N-acetyltransferase/amino-acid acetyltransferase ArgJ [Pseudomonadota bacterium]|nr:bifunctional glutamate N-acetyltransferase/amino-acid acetyltransferase ArgJ [Pseudomonadota bacterium]